MLRSSRRQPWKGARVGDAARFGERRALLPQKPGALGISRRSRGERAPRPLRPRSRKSSFATFEREHNFTLCDPDQNGRRRRWSIVNSPQPPGRGYWMRIQRAPMKINRFEQSSTTTTSVWVLRARSRGGTTRSHSAIYLGSPIVERASLDRALPEPSRAEAMQRATALDPSSIS